MDNSLSNQRAFLGSLPFELLSSICEYVALIHEPSTLDLALVNHTLHAAATASLFYTIRIEVQSPAKLTKDVEDLSSLLARRGSQHVRCLVISGRMRRRSSYVLHLMRFPHDKGISRNNNTRKEAKPRPSVFHFDQALRLAPSQESFRAAYENDGAWRPLALLIAGLPNLADLVYRCRDQLSPCLLQALEVHQPNCRLHMKTFGIRCLHEDHPDPHEFAIAKSPCLHSVCVAHDTHFPPTGEDDSEDAVMKYIVGLAPNLKEVSTISVRKRYRRTDHRPGWQNFKELDFKQESVLRFLQVLDLDGSFGIPLGEWLESTDLTTLKTVRYHQQITLTQILHMRLEFNFRVLTTLGLHLLDPPSPRDREMYQLELGSFLKELLSLQCLELVGEVTRAVFLVVLQVTTPSLRKLCLLHHKDLPRRGFIETDDDVKRIGGSFPCLEELILNITRSRGNAHEVAIYQALGSMPKLRSLSLTLDVSKSCQGPRPEPGRPFPLPLSLPLSSPNDATFDDYDRQTFDGMPFYRNGHVRDLFINSAIDSSLACAIFHKMSAVQPTQTSLLGFLQLQSCIRGTLTPDLRSIAAHLSRSWTVKRAVDQDKFDTVIAIEEKRDVNEDEASLQPRLNGRIGEIFRRIWPEKKKGSDWREDWKSYPLCED